MSDDLHRFYFRWSGHDHKGTIKIGDFKLDLNRLPRMMKWFDIFYSPPNQMEIRERACDEKREMYTEERAEIVNFLRPIGALVRQIDDLVKG